MSKTDIYKLILYTVIVWLIKLLNPMTSESYCYLCHFCAGSMVVLHGYCVCWHFRPVEQTQWFDMSVIAIIMSSCGSHETHPNQSARHMGHKWAPWGTYVLFCHWALLTPGTQHLTYFGRYSGAVAGHRSTLVLPILTYIQQCHYNTILP